MRIYQLTAACFTIMAALTVTSCASNDSLEANVNPIEVTPTAKATTPTLVFNFITPNSDALHYTRAVGDPIADEQDEAAITSLWMYEFDASTGNLIYKQNISSVITDATQHTSTYTYKPETTDASYEYTNNDARQFVFVANHDVSASMNTIADELSTGITSTLTDLKGLMTTQLVDGSLNGKSVWEDISSTKYIPMTAFAILNNSDVIPMKVKDNETTPTPISVDVKLTRIVARIDVVNNTPNLEVTSIKLVKAADKSYLLHKDDNTIPTATKVSMTFDAASQFASPRDATPYKDMYDDSYIADFLIPDNANHIDYTPSKWAPATLDNVVLKNVKLEQAFYVYEDIERTGTTADAPAECLHIQVRGILEGIAVSYNIPFSVDLIEGNSFNDGVDTRDGFAIKRNNLYTVWLGDGKPAPVNTSVRAKIRVLDWKKQEVNDEFDDRIFKLDANGTSATMASDYISTKVINISDAAVTTGNEFKLTTDYTQVVITAVTVNSRDANGNSTDWLTATKSTDKIILFEATANTGTASRSASVKVEYTVDVAGTPVVQTPIEYTIIQAAP
ncbi:MAG: hypothetical protein IJV20_03375 [Prevotella sp.]|nr:hypothetical protein [Prevotella sp.]